MSEKGSSNLGEMDLFEHLAELRRCLIISLLAVFITAVLCYVFADQIFHLIAAPYFKEFPSQSLIGTGPAEAFILKMKVALFSGLILASPVVFYSLWRFISPGLYEHEKKMMFPFVAASTALFLLGVWFCYAVVLPFAFEFFHEQYVSIGVTPAIRVSEHLSMIIQAMVGFGAIFETPVLAYFLGRAGIIDHHTLIGGFRYAVVIIFILAAVLTPPDVVTQFLMAGPLLALYGVSILIVKFAGGAEKDT